MGILTPANGTEQFKDILRGLRVYTPGTAPHEMQQSQLSWQDLIMEMGKKKIRYEYYPHGTKAPCTHVMRSRCGEVIPLKIDSDRMRIVVLVEDEENPEELVSDDTPTIQEEPVLTESGKLRRLISWLLRRHE